VVHEPPKILSTAQLLLFSVFTLHDYHATFSAEINLRTNSNENGSTLGKIKRKRVLNRDKNVHAVVEIIVVI